MVGEVSYMAECLLKTDEYYQRIALYCIIFLILYFYADVKLDYYV